MTRTIVLEGLSGIAYGPFENDEDLQRWLDAQDHSEGEFNAWELRAPMPDLDVCEQSGTRIHRWASSTSGIACHYCGKPKP